MDRRGFLRTLPVLTAVGTSTLASGGCAGLKYISPGGTNGALTVRATEVPTGGALVQSGDMVHPIWVRREESGVVAALLLRCTHRGCQPDPVGDRLVCPCHGSEFDTSGEVLTGPAERPLTRYEVEVEGDFWIVQTGGGSR